MENIVLQPKVSWSLSQHSSGSSEDGMKLKIENATKYRQKAVKISFVCGCKGVCVYGCGFMCAHVHACF